MTPPIHHEWMGLAGEGRPFPVSPVDQPQPQGNIDLSIILCGCIEKV